MMKILLRKLKKLDINARVLHDPEKPSIEESGDQVHAIESTSVFEEIIDESLPANVLPAAATDSQLTTTQSISLAPSTQSIHSKSGISNRRKSKSHSSRQHFDDLDDSIIPNLKFVNCRPIDLAIMKKVSDFDLVSLLAQVTDRNETCGIYRGNNVEAKLNFMQLAMAVHGSDLAEVMFQERKRPRTEEGVKFEVSITNEDESTTCTRENSCRSINSIISKDILRVDSMKNRVWNSYLCNWKTDPKKVF